MIVKTLIAAIVMVAIVMLALGVKLLFDKNAEFTSHSCALDNNTELDKEELIAIDTEADSLHHYFTQICLIQISTDKQNWILDPIVLSDLSSLWKCLQDKHLVFHGGDYDLRLFQNQYHFS